MRYVELDPPPALAPFVQCLWLLEGRATDGDPERVLPDGRSDLVLHAREPFAARRADGSVERQPQALFAGQLRTAIQLVPRGEYAMVGARFRPFGSSVFLGEPAHRLTDRLVPLGEVLDAERTHVASERVREAPDARSRLVILTELLAAGLGNRRTERRTRPLVAAACARITASGGRVQISTIAKELGTTRRSLERHFRETVGLSPKELARTERFQRALALVGENAKPAWTSIAAASGYSDQSHLIREFQRLAGVPPGSFAAQPHDLSDCFIRSS